MVEQDRRRRLRRLLAAAGVLMAVAAVVLLVVDPDQDEGSSGGDVPEAGSRFREEAGPGERSLLDALAPVLNAKAPDASMSVDRAVAQLFAVGFEGKQPPDRLVSTMRSRAWGVVLVGATNYESPSQLREAVDAVARAARRGKQTTPVFAADPTTLGNLGPAPAPDLGLEGTPEDALAEARDAARRLREVHLAMALAPSADLSVGGGPAEGRAFSDDPREAARFVEAAAAGWIDGKVIAVPGRFPGEGGASQDPLVGPATVGLSVDELAQRDVEPFRAAVRAGVPAVQMSAALYAAWDGVTPATVLPDAVRVLREATRFGGAVVSADLVAASAAGDGGIGRAAVDAIKAGCDLLLVAGGPAEQQAAYEAVVAAVRSREIPRPRFIDAVRRVAKLKEGVRPG